MIWMCFEFDVSLHRKAFASCHHNMVSHGLIEATSGLAVLHLLHAPVCTTSSSWAGAETQTTTA